MDIDIPFINNAMGEIQHALDSATAITEYGSCVPLREVRFVICSADVIRLTEQLSSLKELLKTLRSLRG